MKVNLNRALREIHKRAGQFVKKSVLENFEKEGFVDSGLKKWRPRKKDAPHKILDKSGRLKKSIKTKTNLFEALIYTNVPYSIYHNEGADYLPQRQFLGESKEIKDEVNKIIVEEVKKEFERIFEKLKSELK
jgi:phage gpG-like protein